MNEFDLKLFQLILINKINNKEAYNDLIVRFDLYLHQKQFKDSKPFLENLQIYFENTICRDDLKCLPSLYEFKSECFAYQQIMSILFNIIDKQRDSFSKLDQLLLSNIVNNYENNINVSFSCLYLFLYYIYMDKDKKKIQELEKTYDLKNFLDGSSHTVPNDSTEFKIFKYLKLFINNADQNLRARAFKLCDHLNIPLVLTRIIKFSMNYYDTDLNNLIILIGLTGSGKTTLLNYLNGTQYEKIMSDDRLIPKQGFSNQLKVGHFKSEPFYCELMKIKTKNNNLELNFLDMPGNFNKKSIFSVIGMPLAISRSKSIQTVVLVLDFHRLTLDKETRRYELRKLANHFNQLFKSLNDIENNFQFIFAITKADSILNDSDLVRLDYIHKELKAFKEDRPIDYASSVDTLSQIIEEKDFHILIYQNFLDIIKDTNVLKFRVEQHLMKRPNLDLVNEESQKLTINIRCDQDKKNKHNDLIISLTNEFSAMLSILINEGNPQVYVDSFRKNIKLKIDVLKMELEFKKQEKAELLTEISMLNIISNASLENTFFFDCNENDDKFKFIDRLEKSAATNQTIDKEIFNLKIDSQIFENIQNWCHHILQNLINNLKSLNEDFENLTQVDMNLKSLQKEILIQEKDLGSYIKPGQNSSDLTLNDSSLVSTACLNYESSRTNFKCIENSIAETNDLIEHMRTSLVLWKNLTIKRPWYHLYASSWTHDYSTQNNKIPIQEVLLFCFDKTNKLLRCVSLRSNERNPVKNNFKIENHGEFNIKTCDLSKGVFKMSFKSEKHFQGLIQIQIFIKEIDHPDAKSRLEQLEYIIELNKKKLAQETKESARLFKAWKLEKKLIDWKRNGILDDHKKLTLIAERLISLNYNKSKFLDKLIQEFPHLAVHTQNLSFIFDLFCNDNPKTKTYERNDQKLEHLGINIAILNVFSQDFEDKFKLNYLNDENMKLLVKLAELTGYRFSSIQTICKGLENQKFFEAILKQDFSSSLSLIETMVERKKLRNEHFEKFINSKKEYMQKEQELNMIHAVKELFGLENMQSYQNFTQCMHNIQENKILTFNPKNVEMVLNDVKIDYDYNNETNIERLFELKIEENFGTIISDFEFRKVMEANTFRTIKSRLNFIINNLTKEDVII